MIASIGVVFHFTIPSILRSEGRRQQRSGCREPLHGSRLLIPHTATTHKNTMIFFVWKRVAWLDPERHICYSSPALQRPFFAAEWRNVLVSGIDIHVWVSPSAGSRVFGFSFVVLGVLCGQDIPAARFCAHRTAW